MSARATMRAMRSCSQAMRMSQGCINILRSMEHTPQMKLRPAFKLNQMELLSKKFGGLTTFTKMNKAELRRAQIAMMTVLVGSSATILTNLAESISALLSNEEEEEGSSSGVRRRRRRRTY